MVPRGWRTDAAHPVPVVRRTRPGRVLVRRSGAGRLPGRALGAFRRGLVAIPFLPRQPEGPLHRALGAHARLPPLVRPRQGHDAVRFIFAGVEYEGREGETLAEALVRNGIRGGFRS